MKIKVFHGMDGHPAVSCQGSRMMEVYYEPTFDKQLETQRQT